jgi:hypothetical protein
LIEDEEFRKNMAKPDYQEFIHKQQFFQWRFGAYLPEEKGAAV